MILVQTPAGVGHNSEQVAAMKESEARSYTYLLEVLDERILAEEEPHCVHSTAVTHGSETAGMMELAEH